MTYTCPCCGYNKLDQKPYKNIPDNPHPISIKPPYSEHWGEGSYDVCDCCGFEFGFDDNPGNSENQESFQNHLAHWVSQENAEWFTPSARPNE